MEEIKIYRFKIKIWQDFSIANKELPLHIRIPYKAASSGVFNILKSAMKNMLKTYEPHKEGKKYVVQQDCQTMAEAKEQNNKITAFFYGEDDKFKTKEEVKKYLSMRPVQKAISKMKKKVVSKFTDGNKLLDFLTKFSIFISWDISTKNS